MAWDGIQAGDHGWVGKLRIVQDDEPQDISSYTTRQYILTKPDGSEVTKAASFDTDGTDGYLAYTFLENDIQSSEAGTWKVKAKLEKTGARLTSETMNFTVSR